MYYIRTFTYRIKKSKLILRVNYKYLQDKYSKCIIASENVSWKIKDLLPSDHIFDFSNPFLPKALTLEDELTFLNDKEKLDLNHIRAVSYINVFAFIEEYIIALQVKLASEALFSHTDRLRAILRFSEEEVKHQTLFNTYVEMFNKQFKVSCNLLSNADELANIILSNSELSVNLLTYHLELITQQHYIESIKNDGTLDKNYSFILKQHWVEESQHVKIDLLEAERLREVTSLDEYYFSLHEYFNILDSLSEIFLKQTKFNIDNFQRCTNKIFTKAEKELFIHIQHYSYLKNFILMGLKNVTFQKELLKFCPKCIIEVENKINEIETSFKGGQNAA